MYHTITRDDRIRIKQLKELKLTNREIANLIGISERTLYYELKRGSVEQIVNSDLMTVKKKYMPDIAHKIVKANNAKRGRKTNLEKSSSNRFYRYVYHCIIEKRWSPDATIGNMIKYQLNLGCSCCTSTLYNYIYKNQLKDISKKNLWRKGKNHKSIRSKSESWFFKNLPSIDDRPSHIKNRLEFGHWEIDSIISAHHLPESLIVMTERKTRYEFIFPVPDHTSISVKNALDLLEERLSPRRFCKIFKSITADNGSEFKRIGVIDDSILKPHKRTSVFFCHPATPNERGSNENQNAIIRRFIPSGTKIKNLSTAYISNVQNYLNTLPRKILNYSTSEDCFRAELKHLKLNMQFILDI